MSQYQSMPDSDGNECQVDLSTHTFTVSDIRVLGCFLMIGFIRQAVENMSLPSAAVSILAIKLAAVVTAIIVKDYYTVYRYKADKIL